MIQNDVELNGTLERIAWFQQILMQIRAKATPEDFDAMSSGYRCELKKMQDEVLEYLSRYPDKSSKDESREPNLAGVV